MSSDKTIDLLLAQYEIVQRHQQDSNLRLFQLWVGFGAIITATGALIITNQVGLVLFAPLIFVLWFFVLGMMHHDNLYRAAYLSYLEQRMNAEAKSKEDIFAYESFASEAIHKLRFKGRWGIPVSAIWSYLATSMCLAIYTGVCVFSVGAVHSNDPLRRVLIICYSILPLLYIILETVLGPRELRLFSGSLDTKLKSDFTDTTSD